MRIPEPLAADPIEPQKEYTFGSPGFLAKWIAPGAFEPEQAGVWVFRNRIKQASAGKVRVHVSADQRYILFLDGKRLGRGPERGDFRHWMYETYDLDLSAGEHVLTAMVWWISPYGDTPPGEAQQTVRPAFFLMADDESLRTGTGAWEFKRITGVTFKHNHIHKAYYAVDPRITVDGNAYPWGIERGEGDGWTPATTLHMSSAASRVVESQPHWLLRPAMLPPMREGHVGNMTARHVEALTVAASDTWNTPVTSANAIPAEIKAWDALVASGTPLTIPPRTRRRAIIDLQNYVCAYTHLVTSGGRGASVRMLWSEALYLPDPKQTIDHSQRKENRNEIENRYFHGYGDTFIADGGKDRHFGSIWWAAGRYIEVVVETAEEPLTIQSIGFTETGYPYDFDASFESSEPLLAQIMPRGLHTLKMCSHETSMDCPHFEQLNYAGDTRLQSLVAMHCTADDRLVRKGIRLFDWSRSGDNWTASRYPTRTLQTIPPFALWWVGSVLDYARYRGDRAFLSQIMPGVRGVMERWRQQINDEGLVVLPAGWNFVDWIPGWPGGTRNEIGSPGGVEQWQVAYGLNALAQLEEMMGEPLLAQRNRQTAAALAATAERVYFDKARGMLADNLDHSKFSEHTQVMALVSGQVSSNLRESASKVLTTKSDLKTSSIYFSHYTFEALREIGRIDTLIERLAPWFDHAKNGLYTLIEQNEPTRSDCHAWGAHPIYHFFATILGVRPTAFGFEKVEIRPQLGPLTLARGEMFHPRGRIRVDLQQKQGRIAGEIALPDGLTGTLIANGQAVALKGGKHTVG